jgi:hypothetical protein
MSYDIVTKYAEYDVDIPDLGGRASVVSFSPRHTGYQHPDEFDLVGDKFGDISSLNPGLRRKLETGTAFILSCYQHSGVVWSLKGTGPHCRWDTAPVAGILFIQREPGKSLEYRQGEAVEFLREYNAWCNGEVFDIQVWNGEDIIDGSIAYGYVEAQSVVDSFKKNLESSGHKVTMVAA